jgi:hypothetical protein
LVGATAGWPPAHATPGAARDAAVREFWSRVDPDGQIRALCGAFRCRPRV